MLKANLKITISLILLLYNNYILLFRWLVTTIIYLLHFLLMT